MSTDALKIKSVQKRLPRRKNAKKETKKKKYNAFKILTLTKPFNLSLEYNLLDKQTTSSAGYGSADTSKRCPGYDNNLHLEVRLEFWDSEECRETIHYHFSQFHSDLVLVLPVRVPPVIIK